MGKLIPQLEVKDKGRELAIGFIDLNRDFDYFSEGKQVRLKRQRQAVLVPPEYSQRMNEINAMLVCEGQAYPWPDSPDASLEVQDEHFATHYFPDPNREPFHLGLPTKDKEGLELIVCEPIILVNLQ